MRSENELRKVSDVNPPGVKNGIGKPKYLYPCRKIQGYILAKFPYGMLQEVINRYNEHKK